MLKSLLSFAAGVLMFANMACANYHGFSADDVADFEILPGWRTSSGTHMTALRVVLEPGWKTYWRAPGEAGIPARFDWGGSKNISAVQFHWPTPDVYYQNSMRSVGYEGELILPIEITPRRVGAAIAMRADVEFGVCQDICIPVSIRLAADLNGPGASDNRIKAAIKAGPLSARAAGMSAIACQIDPIADGLRLTAQITMPALGRTEIAVVELPDQSIWISEAAVMRQGKTLTAVAEMVPANNRPFSLNRSQVRITVIGGGRAVDIQGCKR